MSQTPNLELPYILAAQSQKHVTHNEAIRMLDALVQLTVLDRDVGSPPASPMDGDRYIIAIAATAEWAGRDNEIAAFQDGAWAYFPAQQGWLAWVADEDRLVVWDGAAWTDAGGATGSVNPTPLVGVNSAANTTNRLSVAAPATLFNHEGDDHRLKVNKAAEADTASLLYQTAFSGRAEIGLTGNDDLRIKVSNDGGTWHDALVVDAGTGSVTMPNTAGGGGGGVTVHGVQNGRLTLVSGDPAPVGDVFSADTVYWTPACGNQIGLWTGSEWTVTAAAETGLSLTGLAANTNHDIFGYISGGALALAAVAWSFDTVRSTALAVHDGVYVQAGDSSRRYLGTLRTSAVAGQCEDSAGGANTIARRYVFNANNRVARRMFTTEPTVSWTYATNTWRRMNNNANLDCRFVLGLDDDPVRFWGIMTMTSASTPAVGIGLDWTSGAPTADTLWALGAAGGAFGAATPVLIKHAGAGHHSCCPLEWGNNGASFRGTNVANNCGIEGYVLA